MRLSYLSMFVVLIVIFGIPGIALGVDENHVHQIDYVDVSKLRQDIDKAILDGGEYRMYFDENDNVVIVEAEGCGCLTVAGRRLRKFEKIGLPKPKGWRFSSVPQERFTACGKFYLVRVINDDTKDYIRAVRTARNTLFADCSQPKAD